VISTATSNPCTALRISETRCLDGFTALGLWNISHASFVCGFALKDSALGLHPNSQGVVIGPARDLRTQADPRRLDDCKCLERPSRSGSTVAGADCGVGKPPVELFDITISRYSNTKPCTTRDHSENLSLARTAYIIAGTRVS